MEESELVGIRALSVLERVDGLLTEEDTPHGPHGASGGRYSRLLQGRYHTLGQATRGGLQVREGVVGLEVCELGDAGRRGQGIP